jgi:predicted nicotinamide N-methyase
MPSSPTSDSTRGNSAATSAANSAAALANQQLDALDYASLRAAIEAIVPLVEESQRLGGIEFRWHKVAEPDRLLSEAVDESHLPATDVDPFWAVAWRAAQGLDAFLERFELSGVRVLELGAGSGHAGLAAAARGGQVTLTDTVDLALLIARLNSWPVKDRVIYRRLRWGEQQLDAEPFPLILGSDLVYDPNHFPQLERCARQHLAAGGRWILSEPNRHTGDRFGKWIVSAGWECDEHQLDLGDGRVSIRIFDCRLPG